MLRFQKEQWCKDATNEELLNQFEKIVFYCGARCKEPYTAQDEEANNDLKIIRAEMLRRMNKEG